MKRIFDWIVFGAMALVMWGCAVKSAHAQLLVKCTVLPSSVISANVANVHGLDEVQIHVLNQGAAPRTIPSFIYLELSMPNSTIPFMDPSEAQQILNSAISKSFWSRLDMWAGYAADGVTAGAVIAKTSRKFQITSGVAAVAIPLIEVIAGKQTPTATALFNQAQYPVTLPPGGTMADYEFATLGGMAVSTAPVATASAHIKIKGRKGALPPPIVVIIP